MTQGNIIAWLGSLEAIVSRHHTGSGSTFPVHPPQIIHKSFRFFIRCKVAARSVFRLEHNVRFGPKEPTQCLALSLNSRTKYRKENDERSGGLARLLWKERYPDRHLHLLRPQIHGVARSHHLEVDPHRRRWARSRKPVDRYPRQH